MFRWTALLLTLSACSPSPNDLAGQSVSNEERDRVIGSLVDAVSTHYVLEEVVQDLADSISNWQPSHGAPIERAEFIESILQDIIRWSGDQHFLLFHPSLPPRELSPRTIGVMTGELCWADPAVREGAHVLTNVVRLPAENRIRCAMENIPHAALVVLDLRECTGGSRSTVAELLSYFFSDPVHFATYYERNKDPQEAFTRAVSRGGLGSVPLAVLVGSRTASGCEAIAYHLQQLGRAAVVGSTTLGAAHAVRTFDLPDGYRAFIPVMRSTSPASGTDWEQVGVQPDLLASGDDPVGEAIRLLSIGR